MVIKALPLLAPLPGTFRRDIYTMQWASMMILLYFTEGVVRAWSDKGLSAQLALVEIMLSLILFAAAILFVQGSKNINKNK